MMVGRLQKNSNYKKGESFDSPFILLYYIYMGYVYLIQDINNDTYKIGVTKGDPKTRLKKLQTGNSTELILRYVFETKYPFRLETMLHNKYSYLKEMNEWYALPFDVVKNWGDICNEMNNIILVMMDNPFFNKNLK